MTRKFDRVIMVVIDGLGVGSAPDAGKFADQGADTLGRLVSHFRARLQLPTLERLGLGEVHPLFGPIIEQPKQVSTYRLQPTAVGKSSLESYWELLGVPTRDELTAFPRGFSDEIVAEIEQNTHRSILVNKPYNLRQLLADWGDEQVATGNLLLTTSGGSDLQIVAHETTINNEELSRIAKDVRKLFERNTSLNLGVVQGIMFTGNGPYRVVTRESYNMKAPDRTLIDRLKDADLPYIRLDDLTALEKRLSKGGQGLYLATIKSIDKSGRLRDPERMGQALMKVDNELGKLLTLLNERDMLLVTASHGADPDFPDRGLTREWLPLMMYPQADEKIRIKKLSDLSELTLKIFGIADDVQ